MVERSRFAVGRCLDSTVFPRRTSVIDISTDQPNPLFEFASSLEFCPANPSQPAAASRLLSWTLLPFSTSRFGSPPAAGFPGPATFRLQGLATLLTAYSFRARVGLVSCRQRSWDSPFEAFPSRKVTAASPPGRTHMPFLLPVPLSPEQEPVPSGRGSWASPLSRVPCGPARD